ncbi:ribose-phosphate pyrophosphokinase protein [Apiospora hydei]|uniref:Ribose-phosphate pyrophosphokinase protein n=1 Tax=Apiospora hydei TaxID=1337664 RepID=A0ABR1XAK2_9PEZI
MVRNIVILGGNSHPNFSVGETRCEIKDSVRGKDVYIIQSGGGKVNDHFMDLCIMISACKTGSAKRVTAVLPLFPYSRQPDLPYNKAGAPLSKQPSTVPGSTYTFESVPATPAPGIPKSAGLANGMDGLSRRLNRSQISENNIHSPAVQASPAVNGVNGTNGMNGGDSYFKRTDSSLTLGSSRTPGSFTTHDYEKVNHFTSFQGKPGYKQWVAQAGTLVADLLTCSGADHIITLDLHDPQYQGFFDIPVDNLYGRPLLQRYIQQNIPNFRDAVVVSPDAGGAKRATAIADNLNMEFALIHKVKCPLSSNFLNPETRQERRPTKITDRQNATMMLVGDVANKVCVLVDDLADTSNTITRAAKLLKKEGATMVYALLTHGVLSGDAISRINASAIDKIIVTNSVPQEEHKKMCPKLEVLDVSPAFAEAIRRVHHGESISVLFQYD